MACEKCHKDSAYRIEGDKKVCLSCGLITDRKLSYEELQIMIIKLEQDKESLLKVIKRLEKQLGNIP